MSGESALPATCYNAPMKLYRGLKTKEFRFFTKQQEKEAQKKWSQVVALRARGSFDYPHDLEDDIRELKRAERVAVQHFTDKKEIAARYAKDNNGALVTIDVSPEDIIKHFTVEFQNFAKRKKHFELVYSVPGSILHKKAKEWNLIIS